MDIHFKNMSFPVNFWIAHEDSLRSLLPLRHVGFIDRKTGWVRSQFDTANFSLILNGGGEFHRKGRCWKVGRQFHIQIDKTLDEHKAMDVLLHEWAHARAWNYMLDAATTDDAFNKLAHDAAWGVAYAEIYSAYEQSFANNVL
jgi:hypothetical protein